ncbi:tRNA 2-thiouridine(34) synthase MnmA [Entomobacter blattae]|uniref:tRNA-specific 2-thiouridylase MnmA n=1 Tax=Entomobacter blattae TaxID=2762277 RepID=A0A7H1NQS6_9PROT|nr:tRNA 2-thiouridine(34) synthase MnmA [Entomobacter blattae]QNT78136.1 tRNA-specific 2-thiouridylase MnmA [Entomobacter blattae]
MRIMVAMSGGVDSSVVAARLAAEGHEVIGATLQLYDSRGEAKKGSCCAGRDIYDARRVADKLNIAHYVIDAEERFRTSVIQRFAESYARGETPVPCVACNQGVKFTDLLNIAHDLGAEAMATGHYVRRIKGEGRAELHRPVDDSRDQSWFLFATTQQQLEFLRFPLGDMPHKEAVRAEAARYGLDVADKPDSQDICFIPSGDYAQVVEALHPDMAQPGEIVNAHGQVLGQHDGVIRYTVGQSKRLGNLASIKGVRHMVTQIDAKTRRVVIGPRDTPHIQSFFLRDVNWLVDEPREEPLSCTVQIRAREGARPAKISITPQGHALQGQVQVLLHEAAMPAPGQACVFYTGSRVLGGGFILPSPTSLSHAVDAMASTP